jgi:deoxyinosine 3'endonuclease (endonuclease V)
MNIPALDSLDLTPKEAVALQRKLASRVLTNVPSSSCNLIAGADCLYNRLLRMAKKHRLPEPTRLAHLFVNELRTAAR